MDDINNDKELHLDNDGKNKYIQSKVNYPNNSTLYSQKIYLDKNYEVTKVEVLDQDGKTKILLEVKSIDYKPKFGKEYFALESYTTEDNKEQNNEVKKEEIKDKNEPIDKQKNQENNNSENINATEQNQETTNILEDIVYPLYIPSNTHLSTEDTIYTDSGNRAILTFAGEKPFILVEEVSKKYDYLEIIPINGEPLMMSDNIGAISANSLYWTSNGIDYYISSTSLNGEELMTIAEGLTGTSIIVSSEK